MKCPVIAIANQKGGVGKTTTTVNLAQALRMRGSRNFRHLTIDFDPQANTTQASAINVDAVKYSVGDLIRNRGLQVDLATYCGEDGIDIIPATPLLAQVEREMIGMTNSEMRFAQRIERLKEKYGLILIDTAPTFGPLLNSVLNAADYLIIPVDSGVFALQGIKSLLGEIEEIRNATNPKLQILGYLLTLCDSTRISSDILDNLVENFGDQVFETKIRRSVKLREAPALGRTIFHHAPQSSGAEDYLRLADEVLQRLNMKSPLAEVHTLSSGNKGASQGVSHE